MTSRRRFLRSLAAAGVAGSTGLAGCGYRPGGGDIRWRSDEFRSPFRQSRLALADGLLVAVADSTMDYDLDAEEWHRGGQVVAYATDDGSEAWTARLDGELTCHAVGDGGAAVGFDRAVVRYGADGELWRASLPEPPVALAVADGRIYALTETGALVACGEGEVLWRVDLEPTLGSDEGGFGPTVAADASGVYVDSLGGLSALDPADGAVRWRVGNRSLSAGPFLAPSGVLVVAESDLVCHYREDTF